jgi:hypothetical protein
MKVKTLFCNCKGTEDVQRTDLGSSELGVEVGADISFMDPGAHLMAASRRELLEDILREAEDDPDTFVISCTCTQWNPEKGHKMVLQDPKSHTTNQTDIDFSALDERIVARIVERLCRQAETTRLHH